MDVGAEYGYHTADITRTIPISGRFTPRQRALYELVLGAQQAAIDSVRPGIDLQHLNRDRAGLHAGALRRPCAGRRPATGTFIHGLSHWLGMDVHDVGSYATAARARHGLHHRAGDLHPGERLGIRIEDDVLVTAKGGEVLSAGIPRTAAEVEARDGAP